MSDHINQPSTDTSHQSPSKRRFDAIYSFVEKQTTAIMPTPQSTQTQQQPYEQEGQEEQKSRRRTTSLKIPRLRLKSQKPLTTNTPVPQPAQTHDETIRLPDPKMLQARYHTVRLPNRKLLQEYAEARGLPPPQVQQKLDETVRLPSPKLLQELDTIATQILPAVQARKADFLKNDVLLQQSGTIDTDDDPDIAKYNTIPMLILKDVAKQQGQPAPVMQSELTGAAGNAAIVGTGTMVGSVLKYGSNLLIQRGFGPSVYGMYSISYALVSLVAAILNLGLDDAMVRYVSMYRAKKKMQALRGLTIFCTIAAGVVGLGGAVFVLFFAPFLANLRHDSRIIPVLQVMSPLVPMLCIQIIWYGGLQGFKAFKWRVLAERIIFPVVMIVVLVGLLFVWHNIMAIVVATIVGTVASMGFAFRSLIRLLPRGSKPEHKQYEFREWLGFAIPNFMTSIVDMALESTDTLLLAFFAISNEQIGLYMAAIKLSGFIIMPQTSLNSMFAPTIAELHSKGEHDKLAIMFKIVTKWSITLSLPIYFVVTLFSKPLLDISSHEFVEAWPILIAFALGNIINTSTGAVGYLLMMTGHQKVSVFNSLAAVIINAIVGVVLAPMYGAMGVAISTGLAIAVVNLMKLLQVRVFLKIHPYRWDTLKPLGSGIISAALIGGILYFLSLHHVNLFIQLSLVPVFLASYVLLIALFKLDQEDRIVVDAFRKKFKRTKK